MITVSENAVREMIREALGGTLISDDENVPIEPNNVVDQSAAETDPGNPNYVPHSRAQMDVAIRNIVKDVPDEKIPSVFMKLRGAIDAENDKLEKNKDKTMKNDDKKVEEAIRKEVRRVLSEITPRFDTAYSGTDYGDSDDEDEDPDAPKRRKFNTMGDVGGASFEEIAKELNFSVAGAKQAVDKALDKAKFTGTMDQDDLEILVLSCMNDYIKMLSKSGELSSADVQLMKDHPDIVRDLDGFREFLHNYIRRARKGAKLEDPLGESDDALDEDDRGDLIGKQISFGGGKAKVHDPNPKDKKDAPQAKRDTNGKSLRSVSELDEAEGKMNATCKFCKTSVPVVKMAGGEYMSQHEGPDGHPCHGSKSRASAAALPESFVRTGKRKLEAKTSERKYSGPKIKPHPKQPGKFLVHTGNYDASGPTFQVASSKAEAIRMSKGK